MSQRRLLQVLGICCTLLQEPSLYEFIRVLYMVPPYHICHAHIWLILLESLPPTLLAFLFAATEPWLTADLWSPVPASIQLQWMLASLSTRQGIQCPASSKDAPHLLHGAAAGQIPDVSSRSPAAAPNLAEHEGLCLSPCQLQLGLIEAPAGKATRGWTEHCQRRWFNSLCCSPDEHAKGKSCLG